MIKWFDMKRESEIMIGIILIMIAIFSLFILTTNNSTYPNEWGFFCISTNSSNETPYFVGIFFDNETNEAKYVITEWTYSKNQSDFYITVPEEPLKIHYLTVNDSEINSEKFKYTEKIYESLFMRRVDYPYEPEYFNNPPNDQYAFAVIPKDVTNYYGIEFNLKKPLMGISISEKQFILPIDTLKIPEGNKPIDVQKYRIQVESPDNYELISSVPQPSRFLLRGHRSALYQFDIDDVQKGSLSISFQDKELNSKITIFLIIFSAMLGIGFTILIESLMIEKIR